jgi:hypothetical protein
MNIEWTWFCAGVNLLFNANDLLKLIKKTAMEAFYASKPADIVFGKVISTSPLKIKIDQKLILTSGQLVLSQNVTDFRLSVTKDGAKNDCVVHNALKVNDEVILLRCSGGQKYIVMDTVGKG